MSRLAHPVVFTPHPEHTHHAHLGEMAGLVTKLLPAGEGETSPRAHLVVFPPNLPPESMDDVPYGFGPYSYRLFQHEPEEDGVADEKPSGKKAAA